MAGRPFDILYKFNNIYIYIYKYLFLYIYIQQSTVEKESEEDKGPTNKTGMNIVREENIHCNVARHH